MMPDICFLVFAHNSSCTPTCWHTLEYVGRFHGNCQTLDIYYHFGCAYPGMPKVSKITSLQYLYNTCQQMNVKSFFKLILSFLVCVARHAQITQNNKFAISLHYLRKERNDEVDFLHADNYESFLGMV